MVILRSLTDDDLEKRCVTPGGIELRIGKWPRSMIEHEVHHRGQIYLYLAMLGIPPPPLYGNDRGGGQAAKQRVTSA